MRSVFEPKQTRRDILRAMAATVFARCRITL